MRKVRLRKGLGVILFICAVLALLYIPQTIVHDNDTFRSNFGAHDGHLPALVRASAAPASYYEVTTQRAALALGVTTAAPHPTATCRPVRNVAFIKTHKAGSSTVANILQRFGITHNLNFALPRKDINTFGFNYLVRPGEVLTRDKLIPLPENQIYNVLWSHSIYNRTAFHSVMPEDTSYFSILREPFQQFVSSFEYYGVAKSMRKFYPAVVNDSNPESTFLHSHTLKVAFGKSYFSYQRNKQAQDLGFQQDDFRDVAKRLHYINDLQRDFSFIMIMEHFDESLLILKHRMCWNIKDILYIPKNKNKLKPKRTFTESDHEKHREYSPVDYSLYDHFYRLYNDTIHSQKEDFFNELIHFKSLLLQVKENCVEKKKHPFRVPESRWHESFQIDQNDCTLMMMSELDGLLRLLVRMNVRVTSKPAPRRRRRDVIHK